ncbi:MAG: hypothetical protein KDK59_00990 [Simkania sp.]|nr:hypothetical protein [Simkania sp.]
MLNMTTSQVLFPNPAHLIAGSTSLAISYGFQRGIAVLNGNLIGHFFGSAVVNTTYQIASFLITETLLNSYCADEENKNSFWTKLGVIEIGLLAGLFFSNIGYYLISSNMLSLDINEKFRESVTYAFKKTGQYVADSVIKLGLLILAAYADERFYNSIIFTAQNRWERLKPLIIVLQNRSVQRYEHYHCPIASKEDFKELNNEQLEAVRVQCVLNPDMWDAYSLPLQVAFDMILEEKELPLLPLTSPFKEEDNFTTEELKFIAKEYYRNFRLFGKEATFFFHNHVKPPQYFPDKQCLPQVPIPDAANIPSLSKAQIKWFHKILIANEQIALTSDQYSAFARRFFEYNLAPPNENYVFEVEMPPPTSGRSLRVKAYYYYLYVKAGRDEKLGFDDRMLLRQFLIERKLICSVPLLSPSELIRVSQPVLSTIAKQFEEDRFLWDQLDTETKVSYNRAFANHKIEEIRDKAMFTSIRDHVSWFFGKRFGIQYFTDRALMDVTATEVSLAYLAEIPLERLNYLHPSMIPHIPDRHIVNITRTDLVQAVPRNKLFFIHPKVYPLLTKQQKNWMEELPKEVSSLSIEQTRLLLCPWLVSQVSPERLFAVTKKGKEFAIKSTEISAFHRAFFALLQTPKTFWGKMVINEQTLFDLVPFGYNRYSMIESIYDVRTELWNLAQFFGVKVFPTEDKFRKLMTSSNLSFFAFDPLKAQQEQKLMLNRFKHIIYALKIMVNKDLNLDTGTKETVGELLKQLFNAMQGCKIDWISALRNFEGNRNEFCDCPMCEEKRMHTQEVLMKNRLAEMLAAFKRRCFELAIQNKYCDAHNEQLVNTIDWYAHQLPHLNLHLGYLDQHVDASKTTVTPIEIQKEMIHEYEKCVTLHVKYLLGFGGDGEFRELALDFFIGIIQREALKRKAYIDESWAKDVVARWIWDEENGYKVREGFVNILFYAYGYFKFDPLSAESKQIQGNGLSFSDNLRLVSTELNHLG